MGKAEPSGRASARRAGSPPFGQEEPGSLAQSALTEVTKMVIRQASSLIRSIYPWPAAADVCRGEDAKMAVFSAAKGLVREAEAVVIGLGQPIRWKWLDKVVLTLFLAPYFVFAGFRMLLFRFAAGGMTMGALYLAMRLLASGPPQGSPFWPAAMMAACIIAFRRWSTPVLW